VSKCEVMRVGQKNLRLPYSMRNNRLQIGEAEKDLGVMISSDLKCSHNVCTHIPRLIGSCV